MSGDEGIAGGADGGRGAVAILGLGANIGDPEAQLREAIRRLAGIVRVEAVSSIYLTEPVGGPDQPSYLNLVCVVRTGLAPEALLSRLRSVEAELGRVRHLRNAPRTIDIDILSYDELVMTTPDLTIPHPRLHQRGFVLIPLREVAPEWRHPVLGVTPGEMIRDAGPLESVRRHGRVPYEVYRAAGGRDDG